MGKVQIIIGALLITVLLTLGACTPALSERFSIELDVDSTNPEGTKFVATESGSYKITIIGGSYCYLPKEEVDYIDWIKYGGWRTMLHLYINKPVEQGEPSEWGLSPINFDDTIGPDKSYNTIKEAEEGGQGSSLKVNLDKDDYVILLVYDGSDYYYDNSGTVTVRITGYY